MKALTTYAAALAIVVAAGFLVSCSALSPQLDMVRSAVLERGSSVADRVVADAELVMCRIGTIGSIERRYGATAALAEARRTICKTGPNHSLFEPNGAP